MAGRVLSSSQCERLKEHKYNVEGKSIVEPYLQPFWIWLTYKMPVWLAPNMITFSGLLVNVVTSGILIYHCPTATEEPPSWALLLSAIFLFVYQSLDAIDGKQAKRLNQSSPLGEVVDHGCDAVSAFVVTLACACCLRLGGHPGYFFVFIFNSLFTFYLAHWQSYVSGKLKFGQFDVTEIQLVCCALFALVAIFGTSFIDFKIADIPYFGPMAFWQALIAFEIVGSIGNLWVQFSRILAGGVGKNGSSVADTSVLSPAIPAGLVMLSAFYIFKHSSYQVFQNEPCITTVMFGPCMAKLTWKIVIATMTKHPVDMTDTSMLGPFSLVLINYFSIPVSEYHALLVCAVFACLDFAWYSMRICVDIANCLDINIFTITPKRD